MHDTESPNLVPISIRGRGAADNPTNRFETLDILPDAEAIDPENPTPKTPTVFLRDSSRKIIATNDSPDIGFDASINPYRGCEHGCIYCYARPTHEYLGFSAGLDFETKIMVKQDAPELLRAELSAPNGKPKPSRSAASPIATSPSNENSSSRAAASRSWPNFSIPSPSSPKITWSPATSIS